MLKRAISQSYKAIILVRANPFRLMDITLWPLMTFLSIALFTRYLNPDPNVLGIVLLGVIGWRMLYQFQIEPAIALMEEYWDHSLDHLMVSPIRIGEAMLGSFLIGIVKSLFVVALFIATAWIGFGYVAPLSPHIIMGALGLALSGMVLAIVSIGVVFLMGSQSYGYIFAVSDVLAAFSGVFYPVTVFPIGLQHVLRFFPTTHGFALMREGIGYGSANLLWLVGTLLLWLAGALLFTRWALRTARMQGKLVRMQ